MKKFSLIIALLMVLTMLTTVAAAEKSAGTGYSIAQAQNIAVNNSRQAAIDNLEIKAKESTAKQAEEDKYAVGGGYTPDQALANKISIEVTPMQALADVEVAKRNRTENLQTLKFDVYKTVFDILLTQREKELEDKRLAIMQEKYEMAKAKYALDTLVENDLRDAEYNLESKKNDVSEVEENLKLLNLELKKLLNLPFDDTQIVINEEFKLGRMIPVTLQQAIDNAMMVDTNVYTMSENLKAQDIIIKWTEEYFDEGDETYDDNKFNYAAAVTELNNAKRSLELNVRNKYNELLNYQDGLELGKKYEELSLKKLESAELKYKNGIISKEELLNQQEAYYSAVYQNYTAIYNYNISEAEFENMIK